LPVRTEILNCSDQRWDAFLADVPHDFYHLSGYNRMSQTYDRGRAEAALVAQRGDYFFVPYLIRPLSEIDWLEGDTADWSDMSSAYGYPGPLFRGSSDFIREALASWIEAMRKRGVVCAFVRTHPLLAPDYDLLAECGTVVYRGDTITIDLSLPLEEIWRQTRSDHRRNINRARREGMVTAIQGDMDQLDDFMQVYNETMDRVDAGTYYYFPREYFVELNEVLGDKLSLCVVRDREQHVAAAGLFTECCGIVQFHLSGTSNASLKLQPSKLMLDEVRRWAKERKNRWMHLGGGNGASEENPLFRFKAGFSHVRQPFNTWQIVFDPERYERLQSMRDERVDRPRDPGFFPSYRA